MINKEIYVELPYQKTFQKGLKVQVKNLEQLQAIENLPVDEIYYNDINTYRLAVSKYPNLKITLVLPRIELQKFNLPKTKKVLIQTNWRLLQISKSSNSWWNLFKYY